MTAPTVLVLGVGNFLMGDEGVGVHALHALERTADRLPAGVTLLDGGTGGFHLLSHLQGAAGVILVDAALDDRPVGTVSLITPRYACDYPPALSAHDIGLKDLIEAAAMLGYLPRVQLVTISIAGLQPVSIGLSAEVAEAVPRVVALVHELLGVGASSGLQAGEAAERQPLCGRAGPDASRLNSPGWARTP